ncbi:hypothetical protein GCM10010254_47740 [Streptomyces chromofuscus]|nr:hypothetical protein GCM10010254_47740 [Streptomyces chromofuscus]
MGASTAVASAAGGVPRRVQVLNGQEKGGLEHGNSGNALRPLRPVMVPTAVVAVSVPAAALAVVRAARMWSWSAVTLGLH